MKYSHVWHPNAGCQISFIGYTLKLFAYEKVLKGDINKHILMEYLINNFECEKIYDSNEEVVTDAFFALKHYASGEEDVGEDEWLYFLECLTGRREYNMEEKMSIITESLISRIKP